MSQPPGPADEPPKALTELADYGIDLGILKEMYREWSEMRVPKSVVEQRYLGTRRHHGKLFSKLVWQHLGIRTELPHPLALRAAALADRVAALESEASLLRELLESRGVTAAEIEAYLGAEANMTPGGLGGDDG